MAVAEVGVTDLLASAFSSSLDSTVVSYDQYKKEEGKREAYYEALDINQLFNLSHITGTFGDRPAKASGDGSIEIYVKTLTGKTLTIDIGPKDLVVDLKDKVENLECIPPDQQRLIFDGKQLENTKRVSDYGVVKGDTLHLVLRLRGGGAPTYYIDDSLLDPAFDYDFTGKRDDGTVFYRGGERYYRPYGWKRCALKVLNRYSNNKWLGDAGHRVGSCDGEWPVSYHGTGVNVSGSIAQEGYNLSKGKRFLYGKGIYSTPSIEVAAKYAHRFYHKGKPYRIVFQNRVSTTDLKVIDIDTTGKGEYWVQPHEDLVRPYGICMQADSSD